jgi:hypothetical protein
LFASFFTSTMLAWYNGKFFFYYIASDILIGEAF